MSDKVGSYHVYQEFSGRVFMGAQWGRTTIAATNEEIRTEYSLWKGLDRCPAKTIIHRLYVGIYRYQLRGYTD